MLVVELVAGILCEGDEGACDSEDLVVVIGGDRSAASPSG